MKNIRKKGIALLLTVLLLTTSFCSVFAEEAKEDSLEAHYIKTIVSTLAERYRFDITEKELYEAVMDYVMEKHPELLEGAIAAASGAMDPYSGYFDRESLQGFTQTINQEYVGIGVTVERQIGYVQISSVSPDGPAEKAGMLAGDRIMKVGGTDVTSYGVQEIADIIKGEAGTPVDITIERNGQEKTFTVIRAAVSSSTVSFRNLDGVGYLKISRFNSTTPDDVKEALRAFEYQDIKKIVIDVRNNPGGELGGVVKTLDLLVPKGKTLTSVKYNDERLDMTIKSNASFTRSDRELVVLANENSASAAELFAGAIKDNKVGTLVGVKTYGKGSVQEFLGLRSQGNLELGDIKLTVAEYFLPNGESIHGKGIEPDVKVKNRTVPVDTSAFEPMAFEAKYEEGDTGKGVLAIKQRLDVLGYFVGTVDETYDAETAVAVSTFQKQTKLYPYGVMDITTQTMLNTIITEAKVLVDEQLDYAIKLLTEAAESEK